jgi:hypothetical protein
MKLQFPNEIQVMSYTFKVTQDPNNAGGYFSFADSIITIGTKFIKSDPSSVFNVICHEILEVIHVATCTRYDDNSVGGDYKFFSTHKEFEINTNLFAVTIQKFIK